MHRAHATAETIERIFEDLQLEIPTRDTDLVEAGALDSMAFVQLLLQLEKRLGVTVTLDALELDHFRTIHAIAAFVERQTARVDPAARVS